MRLLHTTTLKLTEFAENQIPPYAILSHTWGKEEVLFQDVESGDAGKLKGYEKISECCKQAASNGFDYAWVDTCCIDKKSSSELSEAINSMFRWYQNAEVCYVYLSDYSTSPDHSGPLKGLGECLWFTRGWTLQELLAPASVIFFDRDWVDVGSKFSLRGIISDITEIQVKALMGRKLDDFSVAQRMGWASRRQTTRTEDIAYSLMGLFGVHMPMLYGEGLHSFIRLQEEIMRRSSDHSILAWADVPVHNDTPYRASGADYILAPSPAAFRHAANIVCDEKTTSPPFEMTNRGLHMELLMPEEPWDNSYRAILNCHLEHRPRSLLTIELVQDLLVFDDNKAFRRLPHSKRLFVKRETRRKMVYQSIYILQNPSYMDSSASKEPYNVVLETAVSGSSGITIRDRWPPVRSESGLDRELMIRIPKGKFFAFFRFSDMSAKSFIAMLRCQGPKFAPELIMLDDIDPSEQLGNEYGLNPVLMVHSRASASYG